MNRQRAAWWLWLVGTILIVLSWFDVVGNGVGWAGFVIGLIGSVAGSPARPSRRSEEDDASDEEVLADRPVATVRLTRDSVAAGDDADAPHERTLEVPTFVDPVALANHLTFGYLPSVAGKGHA